MTRLTDDQGSVGRGAAANLRSGIEPTPPALVGSTERTAAAGTPLSRAATSEFGGPRFGERSLAERLAEGLAVAQSGDAVTCIALPVAGGADAAIVAAWPSAPMVVWSSADTTVVGVGVARELRGSGNTRYADILAEARRIRISAVVGHSAWAPRVFGGVAFVPGAADGMPWHGFGDAWFALPRWTYSSHGWLVLAVDADAARDGEKWQCELQAFQIALAQGFTQEPPPAITAIDSGDPDAWRRNVSGIVSAIERGDCAKVVAARHTAITLEQEIRAADLLAELTTQHEGCTRLLVRPGDTATLVAATPERLIRVADTWVECDALAGSQPRGSADASTSDEAALLASTKDRREHSLVVEAIIEKLEQFGGEVELEREPAIRPLRHVLHLHTPITARLREKRHVLELVEALHPTPAMGGTPTAAATAWIAAHEPARGWYASPVGWFDLEGNGEFAVAIRCGLVADQQTRSRIDVWAGAGIVAGSDPDLELAETEVKLRAILGALGVAR